MTTPSNGPASRARASRRGGRPPRALARARARTPDARERVERVAAQEVLGPLDGAADLLCLWHQYSPTWGSRGKSRSKCVVRRAERQRGRARRADVRVLVLVDERAEEQRARRQRAARTTSPRTRSASGPVRLEGLEPAKRVAQLALEREEVVLGGLDPHQKAVERGNVDAGRVPPALERLDERRPRACERIEDVLRAREMPLEQRLDELRHELPEVRVEPVDVLRPLPLGQVALGPGEVEVQLTVERFLRRSHATVRRERCQSWSTQATAR